MPVDRSLYIQDDEIRYELNGKILWVIDINKIVFIGEYTNSSGPFLDDWFIVFGDGIDQWWEASCYAIDHLKFWDAISKKLKVEIAPYLANSTVWASKVMFPEKLEGEELFVLTRTELKRRTFYQKLFGRTPYEERCELTDNVKKLFK